MAQDPDKDKNAQKGKEVAKDGNPKENEAKGNEAKANELSAETKEHLKKLKTTSHAVRRYV